MYFRPGPCSIPCSITSCITDELCSHNKATNTCSAIGQVFLFSDFTDFMCTEVIYQSINNQKKTESMDFSTTVANVLLVRLQSTQPSIQCSTTDRSIDIN